GRDGHFAGSSATQRRWRVQGHLRTRLRRALLDTNVYIRWMNRGLHEDLLLGPDLVRYLSAVVYMELCAGAASPRAARALTQLAHGYQRGGRMIAPSNPVFERAGKVLRGLRKQGYDVRQSSLVNDVLIALTARSLGATVFTSDADFESIRAVDDFQLK